VSIAAPFAQYYSVRDRDPNPPSFDVLCSPLDAKDANALYRFCSSGFSSTLGAWGGSKEIGTGGQPEAEEQQQRS